MKLLFVGLSIALLTLSLKGNVIDKSKESKTPEAIELKVSGTVIDSKTGEPLAGVKIKIIGTNQIAYTNFDGVFEFKNLIAGEYKLECEMVCYEQLNLNGLKIEKVDDPNKIILRLTPAAIKFQPRIKKYEPITCG